MTNPDHMLAAARVYDPSKDWRIDKDGAVYYLIINFERDPVRSYFNPHTNKEQAYDLRVALDRLGYSCVQNENGEYTVLMRKYMLVSLPHKTVCEIKQLKEKDLINLTIKICGVIENGML